jgi:hypothetical protein
MEKIRKVLILLFGHLWGVELTYSKKISSSHQGVRSLIFFQFYRRCLLNITTAKKVDHFYIPRWSHISNLDRPSRKKTNQDKNVYFRFENNIH